MSLRSGDRQLSFEILASDLLADDADDFSPRSLPDTTSDGQRRRRRRSKRKRGFRSPPIEEAASEGEPRDGGRGAAAAFRLTDLRSVTETVCESSDAERSAASCVTYVGVELRQRNVSGNGRVLAASAEDGTSSCGSTRESAVAAAAVDEVAATAWRPEANGGVKKLEKEESLDWEKFIKENGNILGGTDLAAKVERFDNSPFRYFLGELYSGNSLRSTIAVGNEKKRQRVYNTMFHVPWRCERIFDKLCQSFGEDVLQVLFNSAEGLSTCSTDNVTFELMRFILDEAIAVVAFDILP
ncbi:hypothetical protein PR202_gb11179 [Eleusine coracana subsp. coracana]|uniref:Uncharacterized protein n=1 Tax=Eleusine coracana subsp. coracana TaxID=191504 RepID=A0AAV5ELB5_ELECO|nr:hypothetical protein PR202_gb11179 [Eleusine coracana subsp. coracana]